MSDGPKYEPHEFFPVLEKLPQAVGEVVICGGQAGNLLAAVFLTEGKLEKLLGKGNAVSADMDLVITKALQRHQTPAAPHSYRSQLPPETSP